MPRPVYIIASESTSEDARSNVLSIFNVIERIEIEFAVISATSQPPPLSPAAIQGNLNRFVVIAVWMKLPTDNPDDAHQHQMAMCYPDGTEKIVADDNNVLFANDDRPRNRYGLVVAGSPTTMEGTFRFESRMRRVGNEEWIRQDYPIRVVVKHAPS